MRLSLPFRFTCLTAFLASVAAAQAPADFRQTGLAFVKKHCVQCHGGEKPKADLKLDVIGDEASVVTKRRVWENVIKMVQFGEMPPEDRPKPSADEIAAFVQASQDLFARADKHAKPDPGRVTMRRLNRTEYNNTIRDLIGVDFNAAEDFPSDDIGHGFDNIGDVLVLSPVLMERYLAAAETILQRAITPDPAKPTQRHISTKYVEPAGPNVPQTPFRPISTKSSQSAIETGPLFTWYKLEPDGEYIFRAKIYGEADGEQPVKIVVLACGKGVQNGASDEQWNQISGLAAPGMKPGVIVQTIEVKARSAKDAEKLEVKIPPVPGAERIAVGLLKTPEDKPATLHIEYFALEGPLDMRPASQRRLLACDASRPKFEQTREILRRFATRAFRRPAADDEVERLARLVEAAEANGQKWESAMQFAMQAVLVSPKFLFRVELDSRPDAREIRPLDEFQLASRLSYFLWSTMPDDELFQLASQGQLTAQLESQVRRMLRDPKSAALVKNFALQWLQLKRLETFAPDKQLFPSFNDKLRAAMLRETELFFDTIVREDRSILDLIDGRFTFLNEPLARHYGIADTNGNRVGQKPLQPGGQPIRGEQFVRVSLADTERGGLLTHASVLTVTSNPTRTSPVKRGRWVLEQLLGTPPPAPPPNVPELSESKEAALTGSLRQRMEQHRVKPACANCHARMDPIGFAFENYDAIGAFRTKDGNFPIDPAGELPDGKTFQGPADLKAILKEKRDLFARCVAEKLLTYALGRGLEYFDKPVVDRIVGSLAHDDKFSTLAVEIVKSEPFRLRRGM